MKRTFLTGEWRNLIMANYPIDPPILEQFLPYKTELDYLHGDCYVSLVGFQFLNVQVRGISIPFHVNFPEVNLRFYIRFRENNTWKRGVVFLKEIVPKPAVSFIANALFGEMYATTSMKSLIEKREGFLSVGYQWRWKKKWNSIQVIADETPGALLVDSKEEFITEHFWGYSQKNRFKTIEYEVSHPKWNIHPVRSYEVDINFESTFGESFAMLDYQKPESIFLAEGSMVEVGNRRAF